MPLSFSLSADVSYFLCGLSNLISLCAFKPFAHLSIIFLSAFFSFPRVFNPSLCPSLLPVLVYLSRFPSLPIFLTFLAVSHTYFLWLPSNLSSCLYIIFLSAFFRLLRVFSRFLCLLSFLSQLSICPFPVRLFQFPSCFSSCYSTFRSVFVCQMMS